MKSDDWISELAGVFCDPIIVTGAWADTLPPWLTGAIRMERLIENVRAKEGDMMATDAEACAYLSTASLDHPIDHEWTTIFLYVTTKVYERHRTKDSGVRMPDDVRVDSLDKYHEDLLRKLKRDIYETRVKARRERGVAERRENREAEAEKKRLEQPLLFPL